MPAPRRPSADSRIERTADANIITKHGPRPETGSTRSGGRRAVVWFRRDLRLGANPTWAEATARAQHVVPPFVLEDRLLRLARSFRLRELFADLRALDGELRRRGGQLLARTGRPEGLVPAVVREHDATVVFADADVSQLAATGNMHNRAGMIAASFFVEDLVIDWRAGERHPAQLLVDCEPAQNAGNWRWLRGPVPTPRRSSASSTRCRRAAGSMGRAPTSGGWVLELSGLTARHVHAPWEAAPSELVEAGVHLGVDYPFPIVDHSVARRRALAAYAATPRARGP